MFRLILSGIKLIPKKTFKSLKYLQIFFLITAIFEIITIYSIGPAIAILLDNNFLENEKFINFLTFFQLNNLLEDELTVKLFFPIFFLLFFIISQILIFLSIKFSFKISYKIAKLLSTKLYFNSLKKNINELSGLNTNRIIVMLTEETDRFIYSCVMFLLRIFSRVIVMVIFVISFVFINFKLSIFLTIFIIGYYFLFYKKIEKKLYDNGKNITESSFRKVKLITETFTSFREISVFNLKQDLLDDMTELNSKLNDAKYINSSITLLPKYVLETILISSVIIIGVLNNYIFNNNNLSEYFIMMIVLVFAGYKLIPTFQEIFVGTSIIKSLNYTIDQLQKYNIDEIDKNAFTDKLNKKINFRNIKIKDVEFNYDPSIKLINNFNLEINRGEKICLVGESGSGKSTILDLILGFRIPKSGNIFLNEDLISQELENESLKSIISYVPQKVLLLDKTIIENITLTKYNIDKNKLNLSIKLSCLDKFINNLKNGLDTKVGELGKNISGGQAQRVAIARSIYRDTPIIILDEPTSSLDKETSLEILYNLSNMKDKTIIMSSHKIDEIKNLKYKIIKL